jgi:hypothetical protein
VAEGRATQRNKGVTRATGAGGGNNTKVEVRWLSDSGSTVSATDGWQVEKESNTEADATWWAVEPVTHSPQSLTVFVSYTTTFLF